MPAENRAGASGAPSSTVTRVGLVSDTHGWLDPRVVSAFASVGSLAWILHAGDVGDPDVLWQLEQIAPVRAVLGNCDFPLPGYDLGSVARLTVAGHDIAIVHDAYYYERLPGDDILVLGHSHSPRIECEGGLFVVNPGSATQRRSQPSCSVGALEIAGDGEVSARIIYLDDFGPRAR